MKQATVAIVGAGVVGATTAYTLLLKNLVSDLLLIDINVSLCKGQVYDLEDVLSFSNTHYVGMGSLQDASKADIVILCCGKAQQPGQSRMDLVRANKAVIQQVLDGIRSFHEEQIIIVVTNPVDILTLFVQNNVTLPRERVFGSGTFLDTQRLRHLLAQKVGVSGKSIHVSVVGEHGDSQLVTWSESDIAGVPLKHFPGLTDEILEEAALHAKRKAYDIIACKGSTAFGIASCVAAYCESILYDSRHVFPVSYFVASKNICMSVPVVLGSRGVESIIMPYLDSNEQEKWDRSAQAIMQILSEQNESK